MCLFEGTGSGFRVSLLGFQRLSSGLRVSGFRVVITNVVKHSQFAFYRMSAPDCGPKQGLGRVLWSGAPASGVCRGEWRADMQ